MKNLPIKVMAMTEKGRQDGADSAFRQTLDDNPNALAADALSRLLQRSPAEILTAILQSNPPEWEGLPPLAAR